METQMPKRRSTFLQPTPGITRLDLIFGIVFCLMVVVACVGAIYYGAVSR